MSFITPQFQIASDLHLETPLTAPQYDSFHLNVEADNVLLLGDIGLVINDELFTFLRRTLEENRGCRIFYVLGNHEPYQTTYEHAHDQLRRFEREARTDFGGRFKFLCRDRYDVNETITILGCTLWSAVQEHQKSDIAARSTDLNTKRGIQGWTLDRHREEHEKDLSWLNAQVAAIEENEPHRQISVTTHYSPTMDSRANDPRHEGSSVSSNFVTDLSQERCWQSSSVKLWAFGHTHYSCEYLDEETGKLVVANQRGYAGLGAGRKRVGMKVKIVEAGRDGWEVLERRKSGGEPASAAESQKGKIVADGNQEPAVRSPRASLLHRMSRWLKGHHKSPPDV